MDRQDSWIGRPGELGDQRLYQFPTIITEGQC